MFDDHPSDDLLDQFFDGLLKRRIYADVASHVESCVPCTQRLNRLAVETPIVRKVREARGQSPEPVLVNAIDQPKTAPWSGSEPTPLPGQPETTIDHGTQVFEREKSSRSLNTGDYDPTPFPESGPRASSKGRSEQIGDYELIRELGHGGMGVVYQAKQRKLNRMVALKMLLAGARSRPSALNRFKVEAQAVAKLDHPNIVQIHDIGEYDDLPYFSMEFVDGGTLEKKMDHKPMEPLVAARLMTTVARGMAYAHAKGIIHRDLKPANILLTEDGVPKISDFGLARHLDETDDGESGGTNTGAIMGTPNYMAPEQAEGNTKNATALADVYALGATLYATLTGRPPFAGPSVASILSQVRESEPVDPSLLQPGIPKDLQTIAIKCLQKEPAKRYASAGALADDLDRFLDGKTILARPVGSVEKLVRWCRRKRGQAIATLTAIALGIGFVASLVVYSVQLGRMNTDLANANVLTKQEVVLHEKTSDANYEAMKRFRQLIIPEMNRLGMNGQRQELVAILNNWGQQIERATEGGKKGLERVRVYYLLDLARQYTSADSYLPGTPKERFGKALAALDEAIKLIEPIALAEGSGDLPRANLALVYAEKGQLLSNSPLYKEAPDWLERALQLRQAIVESPKSAADSPDYIFPADAKRSLADSHLRLGANHFYRPETRAQGVAEFRKALELAQDAYERAKTDIAAQSYSQNDLRGFRLVLADANSSLALNEFINSYVWDEKTGKVECTFNDKQSDKLEAGVKYLAAVAAVDGELIGKASLYDWLELPRQAYSKMLFNHGYQKFIAGRHDEARQLWDWSFRILRPALSRGDDDTKLKLERDAALYWYAQGASFLKLKDRKKAMLAFNECLSIRRRLYAAEPNTRSAQTLIVALARVGKAAEATTLLDRELEAAKNPNYPKTELDTLRHNTVCAYSLCAEMLGGLNDDGTPKADADLTGPLRNLRADYLKKATEAAKTVRETKSRRIADLDTDPDAEYWRIRTAPPTK